MNHKINNNIDKYMVLTLMLIPIQYLQIMMK